MTSPNVQNQPNGPDNPQRPPESQFSSAANQRASEVQRLRHESARVNRAQRMTLRNKLIQVMAYLVGALELLLSLRFLLRLTAANPDNTFATVIYGLSRPFINPFSTLFISPTFDGSEHIFDVNILIAMASYLVLLALAIWLVRILTPR